MAVTDFVLGSLASFIANFFSALAGGGSGLFLLPALLFMDIPFPTALATHKIATVGLGVGASSRHLRESSIEPRFCLFLIAAGGPGVVLGAMIATAIPERLAEFVLGSLILVLGLLTYRVKDSTRRDTAQTPPRAGKFVGGVGVFMIGLLNGSLTSGTGLFFTFWLVRWFRLSFTAALSYTMIICSLVYNLIGAAVLGLEVAVNWNFVLALIIGAIVGGYLGSSMSLRYGDGFVRVIFQVSCVLIALTLIIRALV